MAESYSRRAWDDAYLGKAPSSSAMAAVRKICKEQGQPNAHMIFVSVGERGRDGEGAESAGWYIGW